MTYGYGGIPVCRIADPSTASTGLTYCLEFIHKRAGLEQMLRPSPSFFILVSKVPISSTANVDVCSIRGACMGSDYLLGKRGKWQVYGTASTESPSHRTRY
jgi:hypothetical protein